MPISGSNASANHRIEWGMAGAYHSFDCCPIPESGNTGILGLVLWGGTEKGDYFEIAIVPAAASDSGIQEIGLLCAFLVD
jgi:hypothetical protein